MNKTLRLAAAAFLSLAPLAAGSAQAQVSNLLFGRPNGAHFSVVYLSQLSINRDDSSELREMEFNMRDPRVHAAALREINADPAIRRGLLERGIIKENVIDVKTAANGGKIIYVR
jgi:hypothetical protein